MLYLNYIELYDIESGQHYVDKSLPVYEYGFEELYKIKSNNPNLEFVLGYEVKNYIDDNGDQGNIHVEKKYHTISKVLCFF